MKTIAVLTPRHIGTDDLPNGRAEIFTVIGAEISRSIRLCRHLHSGARQKPVQNGGKIDTEKDKNTREWRNQNPTNS